MDDLKDLRRALRVNAAILQSLVLKHPGRGSDLYRIDGEPEMVTVTAALDMADGALASQAEPVANARAIAAVPEMIDLLRAALEATAIHYGPGGTLPVAIRELLSRIDG